MLGSLSGSLGGLSPNKTTPVRPLFAGRTRRGFAKGGVPGPLSAVLLLAGFALLIIAALFGGGFQAVEPSGGSAADAQDDELFDFLLSSVDTPPGALPQDRSFAADGQLGATGKEAEESEGEDEDKGASGTFTGIKQQEADKDDEASGEEEQDAPNEAKDRMRQEKDSQDGSDDEPGRYGGKGAAITGSQEDSSEKAAATSGKSSVTATAAFKAESHASDSKSLEGSVRGDDAEEGRQERLLAQKLQSRAQIKKKPKKFKASKKSKSKLRLRRPDCSLKYDDNLVPADLPDLPPPSFALSYVKTELQSPGSPLLKSRFAGHQSWKQREDSYVLDRGLGEAGKTIHCGFVRPASTSGEPQEEYFRISEKDRQFLSQCRIAVVSALFGNFDKVHRPQRSRITDTSKKSVCFVLFLDTASLQGVHNDSLEVSAEGYVGLWRMVVVEGLPYVDNRVNGKIPKMLSHRLLPNAQYSVWVDSKLRLNADPLYILQRFLIDPKAEFAISQHYHRRCVWEEVARNKFLNKFNHTLLDRQLEAYRMDGLKPFDPNDTQRLLPSNVPEGSFFMRAHTPMSNLFTCLWFNEVDRFSSRDQISFAYVIHKLVWSNPQWPKLKTHMFRDCDRRAMAKIFHHREEEKMLRLRKKLKNNSLHASAA